MTQQIMRQHKHLFHALDTAAYKGSWWPSIIHFGVYALVLLIGWLSVV